MILVNKCEQETAHLDMTELEKSIEVARRTEPPNGTYENRIVGRTWAVDSRHILGPVLALFHTRKYHSSPAGRHLRVDERSVETLKKRNTIHFHAVSGEKTGLFHFRIFLTSIFTCPFWNRLKVSSIKSHLLPSHFK